MTRKGTLIFSTCFNAQMSYDQAVNSPKRHLRIFTKADFEVEHCGSDMRDYIADWCAETLAEMETALI